MRYPLYPMGWGTCVFVRGKQGGGGEVFKFCALFRKLRVILTFSVRLLSGQVWGGFWVCPDVWGQAGGGGQGIVLPFSSASKHQQAAEDWPARALQGRRPRWPWRARMRFAMKSIFLGSSKIEACMGGG